MDKTQGAARCPARVTFSACVLLSCIAGTETRGEARHPRQPRFGQSRGSAGVTTFLFPLLSPLWVQVVKFPWFAVHRRAA